MDNTFKPGDRVKLNYGNDKSPLSREDNGMEGVVVKIPQERVDLYNGRVRVQWDRGGASGEAPSDLILVKAYKNKVEALANKARQAYLDKKLAMDAAFEANHKALVARDLYVQAQKAYEEAVQALSAAIKEP